jgi:hypothetical protein
MDPIHCSKCRSVEATTPELLEEWGWTQIPGAAGEPATWECPAHKPPLAPGVDTPPVKLAAALDVASRALAEIRSSIPPGAVVPPVWAAILDRVVKTGDALGVALAELLPPPAPPAAVAPPAEPPAPPPPGA